ncbi:MAG: sigma-70 family RNA polymerase sigma factor [Candidatus Thiodiazotropha sp.]
MVSSANEGTPALSRNGAVSESPPTPPDTRDDRAIHCEWLAKIARSQDMNAFEQLFRHFSPMIHRFMIRGGVGREEAEELVQETMTRIWINAASFDPSLGAPHTWIYTIARNLRTDHFLKHRRRNALPLDSLYPIHPDSSSQENSVDASLVVDRFSKLSQDQIAVLELNYLAGMSQSEISDHLSVPLGTVKSRTRLAFHKLRRALGISE